MIYNEKEWHEDGTPVIKSTEERYGIRGGQGHSADEIFDGATSVAVLLGIFVFIAACFGIMEIFS